MFNLFFNLFRRRPEPRWVNVPSRREVFLPPLRYWGER